MPQESFHSQNLQGRSFKGQDLTGYDFSQADIRGADFSGATLVGANFTAAQAGLSPSRRLLLILLVILLAGLAGLIMGYCSEFPTEVELKWLGIVVLCIFILIHLIFFYILILRGLGTVLGIFAAGVAAIITTIYIFLATSHHFPVLTLLGEGIWAAVLIGALAFTLSFSLSQNNLPLLAGLCACAFAAVGIWRGIFEWNPPQNTLKLVYLIVSQDITVILLILSFYIGLKTSRGVAKYGLIRALAVNLCTWGSTSFRGADLTEADFSQANLHYADLRNADLTRTCWHQAAGFDMARLEGTYLANPQIQWLVISKEGLYENFDKQDLRYLNLSNAKLRDSSFIGANLSRANLEGADLSRTQLVQTFLNGSDLTGSCLTGACIQDWIISTDTKFKGIKCDFIYLRLPTKDDPDPWRKPDNHSEIFKEGDFADFIAPIIKTLGIYRQQHFDPHLLDGTFKPLDLLHYQGLDPAAAALALKELDEEHPEAKLRVTALEGKGGDKVRMQTMVAKEVNNSQLSAEYSDKYKQVQSLPEADIQARLGGEEYGRIEQLLASALEHPNFYVETVRAHNILFIASDPSDQAPLNIIDEYREINEKLQLAKLRDLFHIEPPALAARPEDIAQALLDKAPEIVHFSGHGAAVGLVFENKTGESQLVDPEALAALFQQFTAQIKCVVLNACYSEPQAKAIARHIDYVIGMHQEIGDAAAIAFSVGFYQALGAGRNIEAAYKMGCVQISLQNIPEQLTPILIKKEQS